MKEIHITKTGSRVETTSYPNGYRQSAHFNEDGYCTKWFDTNGNLEEFEIRNIGTNKSGDPIYKAFYIESSIVKSYAE